MYRGNQVGTFQIPAAKDLGVGVEYAQSHGVGGHVEEIVRIQAQQPVDFRPGQALEVPPQTQHHTGVIAAQVTAATAVGGHVAHENLSCTAAQGNPDLLAQEAQTQPNQNAQDTNQEGHLAPQMGAVGHSLNQPGRYQAKNGQNQSHHPLQHRYGGHVHGYADAAEGLGNTGKTPENFRISAAALIHIPFVGNHSGDTLA